MKTMKTLAGAILAAGLVATPALAVTGSVTFAQFTQQNTTKVAQYTNTGAGNTLTVNNAPAYFVITAFGPLGFYPTTLSLSAGSTASVTTIGPQFQQVGFNGSITFGSAANNYLTVNFTNATFTFDGNGGSAGLLSTAPTDTITYTSNILNLPTFDFKDFSLAFTGLAPAFTVAANGFGNSFTANIAGSFAGAPDQGGTGGEVPEPATWAMLLTGFGMVGFSARRRNRVMTVAS